MYNELSPVDSADDLFVAIGWHTPGTNQSNTFNAS